MIEWKYIELSAYDYQNYIQNEDEDQLNLNNLNISEWQQLYNTVQLRCLDNKDIKNKMLVYENNVIKMIDDIKDNHNHKGPFKMYARFNQELKLRLSELTNQLDLLHLKNISTTFELVISRLLAIEQSFVMFNIKTQQQLVSLKEEYQFSKINKNSHLCWKCQENLKKNHNKFICNQILGIDIHLDSQQHNQSEKQKIQKYLREDLHYQNNRDQVERSHYINQIDQALKNKDKTLSFTSTPLRNLLSEYLHKMMEILESKKKYFRQNNLKHFQKMSQEVLLIDSMKKLFEQQEFHSHISELLELPFSNFSSKINSAIQKNQFKNCKSNKHQEIQTNSINEYDVIRQLQRRNQALNAEATALRVSKDKMENDIIGNLTTLHQLKIKNVEIINKNKQLQVQIDRLQADKQGLKTKIDEIHASQKDQKDYIIENNLAEKSQLLHQIKKLQFEAKSFKNSDGKRRTFMNDQQIQTEVIAEETQTEKDNYDEDILNISMRKLKNNKLKQSKRKVSIQMSLKPLNTLVKRKSLSVQSGSCKSIKASQVKIKQSRFVTIKQNNDFSSQQQVLQKQKIRPKDKIKKPVGKSLIKFKNISSPDQQNQMDDIRTSRGIGPKMQQGNNIDASSKLKKVNSNQRGHRYHKSNFIRQQIIPHNPPVISQTKLPQTSRKIQNQINSKFSSPRIQSRAQSRVQFQPSSKFINFDLDSKVFASKQNHFEAKVRQSMESSTSNKKSHFHRKDSHLSNKNGASAQQINKLVEFCTQNYQILSDNNAFQMIYDFTNHKKGQANHSNFKFDNIQGRDEILCLSNKNHLEEGIVFTITQKQRDLFISLEQAKSYENKTGFWGNIDHCIMVNHFHETLCDSIEIFFQKMQDKRPAFYAQYCLFLIKPTLFISGVKGKLSKKSHRRNYSSEDVPSQDVSPSDLKKIFKKLLMIHNLNHKKCNHVLSSLEAIGFTK